MIFACKKRFWRMEVLGANLTEFSSCALSFGNGLGILQKNTDAGH